MTKTVLITGAAGGLGSALADAYFSLGYNLILTDVREGNVRDQWAANNRVTIVTGDLTLDVTLQRLTSLIESLSGGLEILINNAGVLFMKPFEEHSVEQIDQIMNLNALAPIKLARMVYPLMQRRRKGQIINIASNAGRYGKANHSLYCASKFALTGFSHSLRLEAKQYGVRVMTVFPAGIKTGLYANMRNQVQTSGYLEPDAVAKIIATLSEAEGAFVDEVLIG